MRNLIAILLTFFTLSLYAQNNSEREDLLDNIFKSLEQNVANPAWLQDKAFSQFKEDMYSESTLALDEDQFVTHFNTQVKNLSFTHFYLKPVKPSTSSDNNSSDVETSSEESEYFSWKEINEKTAYLRVQSFATNASEMVRILQEIGYDKYENLIVDLRNNGGGTLDAPVVLGRFLTGQNIDAGVYLTRKWFEKEHRSATKEDIASFPNLQDFTYAGFTQMFQNEAAFRMAVPGHDGPVFKGNVYVLINQHTASACEPLIYYFKDQKIATLIGQKSAGAMLSAYTFPINEKYGVFIPCADYQTSNGDRIDKVGVAPDIEVESEKALDHVLEIIKEKNL
ncbi:S41 family peptidase [Marinigracilibium pacificum]|uniref:Tail specific protease domain-containing protein n=1 Tax=Marinigracilibium pacificum TaxID=2729599 RepID=A0A848ITD2_9BACT|nr:S41 family peptidase [Marinigracilibium pacificum]NMM47607.1 hypothetical protein [Marinigracilibium pacificum]